MLTLVGEDRPGIVAAVTRALYDAGCNLGEASMIRLGGNFTIMLMVNGGQPGARLEEALAPVAADLGLRCHIDPIPGALDRHPVPNIQVRVMGADRAGIVAEVTEVLAATGFNILELDSSVCGEPGRPLYIMNILGCSGEALEVLDEAMAGLRARGVSIDIAPIETMIG
ncbi:amino acid-binding protein [Thiococcus pfennigii]|jgi:glycine cleavage system transcriptional repressor|nr:amino acid-binding protein [Thiococcus pfennigii]MBK1731716.1 amino acid-binding protein [Thiococcus pfennigii]